MPQNIDLVYNIGSGLKQASFHRARGRQTDIQQQVVIYQWLEKDFLSAAAAIPLLIW